MACGDRVRSPKAAWSRASRSTNGLVGVDESIIGVAAPCGQRAAPSRPCGNTSPPLACFVLPRSGFSTLASYHARPRPLRRRVGDRRLPGGRRDRHCKRAPHLRHRVATARRGKGGARARLLRHRELWIHLSVEAHYGLREKGENRVSPYPQTRIAMWLAAAT